MMLAIFTIIVGMAYSWATLATLIWLEDVNFYELFFKKDILFFLK